MRAAHASAPPAGADPDALQRCLTVHVGLEREQEERQHHREQHQPREQADQRDHADHQDHAGDEQDA